MVMLSNKDLVKLINTLNHKMTDMTGSVKNIKEVQIKQAIDIAVTRKIQTWQLGVMAAIFVGLLLKFLGA